MMTTSEHIDAMLAAADLSDRTTRLVLADALEDAGREGEAAVMRGGEPILAGASRRVIDASAARHLYRTASGTWDGCDWTTDIGGAGINCDGMTAEEADSLASAVAGAVADSYSSAADYLRRVEQAAAEAEGSASAAMEALAGGRLEDAARLAARAADLERQFGDAPTWGALADELERLTEMGADR